MNKNIYVKKINTIGNYAVWLMDGALIRKEINENFVKCADNNQFGFVPKNEFWIDEDLDPKEYPYFVDRFIYEKGLLDSGKIIQMLIKKRITLKKERQNSTEFRQISNNTQAKKNCWKKNKAIEKYSGKVKVWLVDGNLVRSFFCLITAKAGMIWFILSYLKWIWIEEAISPQERKFIILHELHERYLMDQGKSYKTPTSAPRKWKIIIAKTPKKI